MNKFYTLLFIIFISLPLQSLAQESLEDLIKTEDESEKVTATFKSGKLINIQTVETIHKKELDFRVDHRFGDIAGKAGGAKQFFGLDYSTDIRIGFDYGISDNLTVGLARAKGAAELTQLYETSYKYKFLKQTVDDKIPVSIALFGSATTSAMEKSNDPTAANSFSKFGDRIAYVSQLIIARKFSPAFSVVLIPTYVHQNYTLHGDQNSTFAIAAGARMKFNQRMALVTDYVLPFRNKEKKAYIEELLGKKLYNALGIGLELETGGHVFHLNFTNATAIQESQYITETTSTWAKGQFRWGFSIARRFSFDKSEK
jgi:hypothetical protein